MSFVNAAENSLLLLFFNGTTYNDIAQNDGSSPNTVFYISGHTSSPADTGSQATNEITYTDYDRFSMNRDGTDLPVTNNVVNFGALESFPAGTGGSGTMTHFGMGKDASGSGTLYCYGTVTPNIVCGDGVTPQLTTATAITLD